MYLGAFLFIFIETFFMKYLVLLFFIFSCSESLEEKCFIQDDENIFQGYTEEKPFTVDEILKNKPDYLQIVDLQNFRSFKQDSIAFRNSTFEDNEKYRKDHDSIYSDFNDKFLGQFAYSSKQIVGNVSYALGRNGLGYWLLEIKNNKPTAYFLGLSFSHYYFNKVQQKPIIKDGFLQIEGSFVKIEKVPGLPGYDDYSAIESGKLFKIKLDDVIKDTDWDGYNDIFEICFGLNLNSKDTDGDKIDDFKDRNPLFTSEKNKFTSLYENLISQSLGGIKINLDKMQYFIMPFETDCDYFQKINLDAKVLIMPTSKDRQPYYVRVTDIFNGGFSKIKKNKNNPNIFYIYESGSGGTTHYMAEFIKGVWILKNVGGINI